MTDVDEILAEITARTSKARVLLRQDLVARHAELDEQIAAAADADRRTGGLDTELPRLAAELIDLEAEMAASRRTFEFRAIGKRRWQNLLAMHPPTKDQSRARPGLDHNPETFPLAAVQSSCVSPLLSLEQVTQLADAMSVAQFDLLWAACLDANVGGQDLPKSLVAGGIARANAALASSPPE